MKDFKNFLKSEAFFNSRNSDQNLSSLVLASIKNNYAPKYLKLSLIMFSVLFLPAVNAASANNISILYGWNGTSFVPATITNTGALLTTINMSKSLGLSPEANNTYDLGTAAKLWANLYVRSLRGSGPISIIGDANVTGTLYVTGLVGDGSNLTNIGANLSLNYGYNGTNWLPLATTADGTLKLSVRDSHATNAAQLTAGSTGTDLTLSGHLIAATANITGGLNVSAGGMNVISGNVGIGTTGPQQQLTIQKTGATPSIGFAQTTSGFTFSGETTGGLGRIVAGASSGGWETAFIKFQTHHAVGSSALMDSMTITQGNVRIGTTSPSA